MPDDRETNPELIRLQETEIRKKHWRRWGPYLADRQWGTVREDYSADGSCWDSFTHDHARSRTYRWGEDGLMGITDRQCRLCFALALWNGKDRILKERLYGLTGPEGNHGEDVKEYYYYLDALPTHAYLKALYKYPQASFPYDQLLNENRRRTKEDLEFELADTGVLDDQKYFDVFVEYAKNSPNDILIEITAINRSSQRKILHLLPTLWFRNTWSWGHEGIDYHSKPSIAAVTNNHFNADHPQIGRFSLVAATPPGRREPTPLFTENQTNFAKLFNQDNESPFVKDAFHSYVVDKQTDAVNPTLQGTKAAFHYRLALSPNRPCKVRLRLFAEDETPELNFGEPFTTIFNQRRQETDRFYAELEPATSDLNHKNVTRQAYAGLMWNKQFYHYCVRHWLEGDPLQPTPAPSRYRVRNTQWTHVYNRDVISMPDKWEYPWYAAWDLAFHALPLARIDPGFAKDQLQLLLREWYMHPNGQIPAYEFAFGDVNPPVHAWACWRVYKMSAKNEKRDRLFLARVFHKLLLNFTWWVNQKDVGGNNLFSGGFLGLDNIGVFDRSQPPPAGHRLEQADATAWMAFYCGTMLSIAMELAQEDPAYEDVASKFFEHFVAITDAVNGVDGSGLWNEDDHFYYDRLHIDDRAIPLRVRSLVGIIPLIAVEVLEGSAVDRLPGFKKRMQWFLDHHAGLSRHVTAIERRSPASPGLILLALPSREQLARILEPILDEKEFLSPFGIRSLSKVHSDRPYTMTIGDQDYQIGYEPGESRTTLFGGNSNWRGPVWLPVNFLIIEALERYHHFYGNRFQVEFPTGSGRLMTLDQVAFELARRVVGLFSMNDRGVRPYHGTEGRLACDDHWRDLILFYEHFHGDTGRGLGASHQTGWTALVTLCIEKLAKGAPG